MNDETYIFEAQTLHGEHILVQERYGRATGGVHIFVHGTDGEDTAVSLSESETERLRVALNALVADA